MSRTDKTARSGYASDAAPSKWSSNTTTRKAPATYRPKLVAAGGSSAADATTSSDTPAL